MYSTIADGTWSYIKKKVKNMIGGGGSILGFAKGTMNAPGGLSLVGEEGPELVNLARGSQVIPAGITSGLLSSALGGITLNNVMTGILTVDGREIGRVAFQNIDRYAMGAYGIKR